MQNVASCPSNPLSNNYTLVVKDSVNVQTSLATGSVIRIVVNDLMEDTRYLYYVVATNQFGSSNQSASVEISMYYILATFDVQGVSIFRVDTTHYSILLHVSSLQPLLMCRVSPYFRLTPHTTPSSVAT